MYKNPKVDLKLKYRKVLELCLIISLALHTILFLGFKKFESQPVEEVAPQLNIVIEDIPKTVQIKAPPPPSRPAIPVASEDEDLMDDVTIEDTEIKFDEIPPPPPPPQVTEEEIPPFLPFEQQPKIIGGYEAFRKTIIYPEIAIKAKVEGQVIIRTLVNKKGIPEKFQVVKGIGAGCEEAVIAALRKTKFTPAMQRDRPVKFWINIPVEFRLVDVKK
ncbi:energy transducer TonB [candidate division KSB1 bacterium]|mgnify:CR=1 FL=1|nr:MAG: energy transducer TonB [candidate division KSB1 bacterium]